MCVHGQSIRWEDNVKYLGNVLACDTCAAADIRVKKGEFIGSVNRLIIQFHVVPNTIRIRLLQTYCTSWYGCQTWLLHTNAVKGLNTEWKKAVRRTLNLSRMTRSKLIPLLAGNGSFQEQHERRRGSLYASMMRSENGLVELMARRAMCNAQGVLGINRVILRYKFGMPVDNAEFRLCYPVSEEDVHRCSVIKELVRARNGCIDLPLSQCEVRALLDHVCIM